MKYSYSTLICLLASALVLSLPVPPAAASPRTYVVAISPNLKKSDCDDVLRQLFLFALEKAATGDTVIVYDALNLRFVTRLSIPSEKQLGGSPRARVQKMKTDMVALKEFFGHQAPVGANKKGKFMFRNF